ncbi:MAG: hypothetical protein ACTSR8_07805 [Promethearchaeota archaeon]
MVPKIILIWLHQLPQIKVKTPVFIINTSGGIPCNSAGIAMDILRNKNYDPLGVLENTPIIYTEISPRIY